MSRVQLVLWAYLALLVACLPQASAALGSTVRVSFLRGEQLAQVSRAGRAPRDALRSLIAGPTSIETAKAYRSSVPRATRVRRLSVYGGLATVDLDAAFVAGQSDESLVAAVSQLVKTLTSFRQVSRVRLLIAGRTIRRAVSGIPLDRPISLRFLETPNVPLPEYPPLKLPAPNPAVKAAQGRLIALRYLIAGDDDGRLGPRTAEGILAFQKVEGLDRTGALDAPTRARLSSASPPVPLTRGGPGKRAEVLLGRQVAFLIEDDRVVRAIAVSSGKPSTPTPPGNYKVYAKIPRWWSVPFREWLPWALPFVGGIAFHEFGVVPIYPASHGCVRQPVAVARWTFDFAEVGMPVRVLAR